jgi:hypothetical protein
MSRAFVLTTQRHTCLNNRRLQLAAPRLASGTTDLAKSQRASSHMLLLPPLSMCSETHRFTPESSVGSIYSKNDALREERR